MPRGEGSLIPTTNEQDLIQSLRFFPCRRNIMSPPPPPPPPKLGQRDLFNDSFFSFLRRKDKSQPPNPPAPATGAPYSPDSPDSQDHPHLPLPIKNGHANPKQDESLGEKKMLLQDGHRILDLTKDLLERNQQFFRKETLKRLRKDAAK